jgi:3-dehydroquinate dehydratase-1
LRDDVVLKIGGHELRSPVVCGAVIGEDFNTMNAAITRALDQGADLIEMRLDGLRDLSGWRRLLREDVPTIVTNRAEREGGHFRGEEDERIKPLLEGISEGVDCIDLELSTPQEQLEEVVGAAKKHGTSVMMSHHDFEKVPPPESMVAIARQMVEAGCDIAKLIGFAKRPRDALAMLDFLVQVPDSVDVPVIAFAMGEAGKFSRVTAPLFGSPIVYAAAAEVTAPGQFDVATARRLLDELGE